MSLLDLHHPRHAEGLQSYLADGLTEAHYLDDETLRCAECGELYDDRGDGREDSAGDFICDACSEDGCGDFADDGDDSWKIRSDR